MKVIPIEIEGDAGSLNLAVAPHLIPDNHWTSAVDILFDRLGFYRQRGPVKRAKNISGTDTATLTTGSVVGIASTFNSLSNATVILVSSSGATEVLVTPYTSASSISATTVAATDNLFKGNILGGGLCFEPIDGLNEAQNPRYWRGANKADYSTGTLTVARGSTSVTGSGTTWTTNAVAGMALEAKSDDVTTDYMHVGWVKSVDSDTGITLENKSLAAVTGRVYVLRSAPQANKIAKVSRGVLTCSTTSTTVSGGNTKWRTQLVSTGTWLLFRKRDLTYIGKVSSIVDDDSITLTASASIDMSDEPYYAYPASTPAFTGYGPLTTIYAHRQVWGGRPDMGVLAGATTGRERVLYFSDINEPFSVYADTAVGDFITVPIFGSHDDRFLTGIAGSFSGLLIWDSYETNLLVGETVSTFETRNLYNDGALNPNAIQPYQGGYIWAGRRGIYYFDGSSVSNIVEETLGDYYSRTYGSYPVTTKRVWSMIHKDHYFVHYENDSSTIVVNLRTRSVSTFTNARLKGSASIPGAVGSGIWYAVQDNGGSSKPVICDAGNLFDENGLDTITCSGETIGPTIVLKSKQFSLGDISLKKWWKSLGMTYLAIGSDIDVYQATGLDGSYSIVSGTGVNPVDFIASSTYVRKRVKFHKFSELLSFKLVAETPGSLSKFWISALTLFVKPQRKERW